MAFQLVSAFPEPHDLRLKTDLQPLASGDGTKSEYYRGKDYGPKQSTSLTKQGMPLTQELKSQQLAAVYGDSPLASTVRTNMLSGGIARMLGE